MKTHITNLFTQRKAMPTPVKGNGSNKKNMVNGNMAHKHLINIGFLAVCVAFFSGCTTVTVYQSPVSQFQTEVNSANTGISTYLLGVNDVIIKANLYDDYKSGTQWSPADFDNTIPVAEIQLRLQALGTISAYANALGAMAESKRRSEFTAGGGYFGYQR